MSSFELHILYLLMYGKIKWISSPSTFILIVLTFLVFRISYVLVLTYGKSVWISSLHLYFYMDWHELEDMIFPEGLTLARHSGKPVHQHA